MWLKAVWLERQKEVEGVLPSNWLIGNHIYWPPVVNAISLLKERVEPDVDKWSRFQLIKVQHSSDSLEDCEEYGTSEMTDTVLQKRSKPTHQDEGFLYDSVLGNVSGNEKAMPQSKEICDETSDVLPGVPLPPLTMSSSSNNTSKPREKYESSRSRSRDNSPYNHWSQAKHRHGERSPCHHCLVHERSPYSHSRSGYRSPRSRSPNRSHRESHRRSPDYHKNYHSHSGSERSRQRERSYSSRSDSSERHSNPLKIESMSSSTTALIEQFAAYETGQAMENQSKCSFPMSEENIKELLNKALGTPRQDDLIASDSTFSFSPLSTKEELEQFNIMVSDPTMRKDLLTKFSRLGGVNVKDMVGNIMNRLMTNPLMCLMNMKGSRGQKIGFGEMPACSLIVDCVMKMLPRSTEFDVLEAITSRLKYAPKRRL